MQAEPFPVLPSIGYDVLHIFKWIIMLCDNTSYGKQIAMNRNHPSGVCC